MKKVTIKPGISLKIIGTVLAVSIIFFSLLAYFNIKNLKEGLETAYMQKAMTVAYMLDANIRSIGELRDKSRVFSSTLKHIWLDPDIISIDINLPQKDALITFVSNLNHRIGRPADASNLKSYKRDLVIREIIKKNDNERYLKVVAPIHIAKQQAGTYQIEMTLEDIDRNIQTAIKHSILSYSVILIIFVMVLFGALRFIIIRPVHEMSNAVDSIAEGDLEYKVNVRSNDEIGRFAGAFNRMTEDLRKSHQRLEERRIALEKEVIERKNVEEVLRESEEKYRLLVENAPLGIVSIEANGQVMNLNNKMLEILRSLSEEASDSIDLFTHQPFGAAGFTNDFRNCLKSEKPGIHENLYINKWGKEVHLRYYLTPIRSVDNEVIGVQAIVEDISKQRNLKAQLMQAQKMESIGALAAGIAHDFNNILTPIISQSALALMDDGIDSTIQNNLQEVMKAGLRAKGLVKQILAFSHQTDQQPIPLKITPIIREALKLLRASLPTNIEIRVNLTDGFDTVIADPTHIHQILINLCTNAAHSMKDKKGILEVGLTGIEADSDLTAKHSELEPGPYLKLTVSDTGHGIAPEVMDRIFEPFFTTKGRGEGTGMGLAVIHGIIKECSGIITVDTELGKGTTFNVFLPLVETDISEEIEPDTTLPSGNERVLVVDDEVGTVNTLRDMLEWLGYQVIEKTNSQEALEVFGAEPDRFDLVLTDQAMPNMTGVELAKILKSIRSDISIILCTGFSETVNKESVKAMGISEFLLKPVEIDELAQVIRKVLDKE